MLQGKLVIDGLLGDETDVFVAKNAHMEFDETDRIASLTGEGQDQLQKSDLIIGDQDTEWGGFLFGDGGLVKDGSGVLTLTGPNSYEGNTTILDGSIVLGRRTTVPYDSPVEIKGGELDLNGHDTVNLGTVTLNGGSLKNSSGYARLIPDVYICWQQSQKFSSIDVSDKATLVLSGVIDGDSSAALKKIGKGELILSGKNTYKFDLHIDEGTIKTSKDNTLSPSSASVIIDGGATLDLQGTDQRVTFIALKGGLLTGNSNGSDQLGRLYKASGGYTDIRADGGKISNLAGKVNIQSEKGITVFSGSNAFTGNVTLSRDAIQRGESDNSFSHSADITAKDFSHLDLRGFEQKLDYVEIGIMQS